MADYTRTGTSQKAMYNNSKDFENKIVLYVGTGSGILAFFALQGYISNIIYDIHIEISIYIKIFDNHLLYHK